LTGVYFLFADVFNLLVPATPASQLGHSTKYVGLYEGYASFLRSPTWVVGALILGPFFSSFWAAIIAGIAGRFGGRGRLDAVYSTLAFAGVPNLLSTPI
jgi:hypothetical protein